MPKRVEPEFRLEHSLAAADDLRTRDTRPKLERAEPVFQNAGVRNDGAVRRREYQIQIALRTSKAPAAKLVYDHRGEGDFTLARLALRRSELIPLVGAATHAKHGGLKIDIRPPKPAQLGAAQARKHGGDD